MCKKHVFLNLTLCHSIKLPTYVRDFKMYVLFFYVFKWLSYNISWYLKITHFTGSPFSEITQIYSKIPVLFLSQLKWLTSMQGRIQAPPPLHFHNLKRKSTVTHHSNRKRDKEEEGKRRISFLELWWIWWPRKPRGGGASSLLSIYPLFSEICFDDSIEVWLM